MWDKDTTMPGIEVLMNWAYTMCPDAAIMMCVRRPGHTKVILEEMDPDDLEYYGLINQGQRVIPAASAHADQSV